MTIENERDRQALLRDAGEPASFLGEEIHVIFNDRFERVEINGQSVAARAVTAQASSLDVDVKVFRGCPVYIRGARYTVENIEPDGVGMTTLTLARGE